MKIRSILMLLLSALMLTACSSTSSTETTQETVEPSVEATAETEVEEVVVDYRDIDVDQLVADGMSVSYATVYGVYNQEGESPDSSIMVSVYVNDETSDVVYIDIEEALIPVSDGGAEGWAILDEETVAALGEAVLTHGENSYPASFQYNGVVWTGSESDDTIVYTATIDGSETDFMSYIATQEGGAWYHEGLATPANILDADGNSVAQVTVGTKASINHGVDFWMSSITFPGNLELLKNYVYDNGVNYQEYPASNDIAQDENGTWVVLDTTTQATLAGTPNYLNLIKEAYDLVVDGQGNTYSAE